ncbi:ankyrin repeat domain-containing protein [Legionella sp. CNM-4043-24]|uniref:ankyrin repeat domain-containing protein n=1 Tax=Legionella sp. CNM-4043-24 TaxID=3421646 RepID=UPI00403B068B
MFNEENADLLQRYLTRIENHFELNIDGKSIEADELALTPMAKSLFLAAEPGQGFVGIVHLNKNTEGRYEIHLLPSANTGDGLPETDRHGRKLLRSRGALGKGGHNIHLQAVLELGLSSSYNQGRLLGFGIWKSGCAVKFPTSLPSANGLIPDEYHIIREGEHLRIYYAESSRETTLLEQETPVNKALYLLITNLYKTAGPDGPDDQAKRKIMRIIRHYHQRDQRQSPMEQIQFLLSSITEDSLQNEASGIKHMRISSTSLNDGSTPKRGEFTGGCRYDDIYLKRMEIQLVEHITHLNEIPRELPHSVAQSILNRIQTELGGDSPLSSLLPAASWGHKEAESHLQAHPVEGLLEYARITGNRALLLAIREAYPELESAWQHGTFVSNLIRNLFIPPLPNTNNAELRQIRAGILSSRMSILHGLIECGEDPNMLFRSLINAFFSSADSVDKIMAYREVIALLLSKGANAEDISWACHLSSEMVAALVEAGMPPQSVLNRFLSQINFDAHDTAMMNSFLTTFTYLTAQGANTETALYHCNADREWLVRFLLERGARPDVFILAEQGYVDLLKQAISQAPPDDTVKQTLMTIAARQNQADVIRALCQMQWNPDLPDSDGEYPVMTAIRYGKTEALTALIESGANLDIRDKSGNSPATLAALKGNSILLEQLAQAGVDLSVPDTNGFTPVTAAASQRQFMVLLCLRMLKIDLMQPDSRGRSLGEIASELNDSSLLSLLPQESQAASSDKVFTTGNMNMRFFKNSRDSRSDLDDEYLNFIDKKFRDF